MVFVAAGSAKQLYFAVIRLMALIKIADLINIADLIALAPRRAKDGGCGVSHHDRRLEGKSSRLSSSQEKEATAAAATAATAATGYDHAERLGQDRRYIVQ